MTDIETQLAKIEAMAGKATPGPWTTKKPERDSEGWPSGVAVAFVARGQGVYANPPGGSFPASDQDFIAAARTDVPFLCCEVRLLQRKLEAVTRWLEDNQPDVFSRGLWDAVDASILAKLDGEE